MNDMVDDDCRYDYGYDDSFAEVPGDRYNDSPKDTVDHNNRSTNTTSWQLTDILY